MNRRQNTNEIKCVCGSICGSQQFKLPLDFTVSLEPRVWIAREINNGNDFLMKGSQGVILQFGFPSWIQAVIGESNLSLCSGSNGTKLVLLSVQFAYFN